MPSMSCSRPETLPKHPTIPGWWATTQPTSPNQDQASGRTAMNTARSTAQTTWQLQTVTCTSWGHRSEQHIR